MRSFGIDPGSSTGSGEASSYAGVEGAVYARDLGGASAIPEERSREYENRPESCGEQSISFMTVIRLVADFKAASCNSEESFVLLLCLDDDVGLGSKSKGGGVLLALLDACSTV